MITGDYVIGKKPVQETIVRAFNTLPRQITSTMGRVGIMPYEKILGIASEFAPELEMNEITARADARYRFLEDVLSYELKPSMLEIHVAMLDNMNPNGNIIEQMKLLPKPYK